MKDYATVGTNQTVRWIETASKNVWCTKPKLIVYVKQNTVLEQQKIRLKQGITTTKSPLSIACMKRKQNSQNISGN